MFAALAFLSCAEIDRPTNEDGPGALLAALIVSGPTLAATASAFGSTEVSMTYISLPPGTLPLAVSVRVRNRTSGEPATPPIAIVDGGFDPIAIGASAGDVLELTIHQSDGRTLTFNATVPRRRPPSVVRTNPPKGRTDVALSTRPTVIFSEPIDPRTLSTTSLQLLRSGTTVSGSVALEPTAGWSAEFTPTSLLEPGTMYALVVTRDIRDLNGDPIAEPITTTFTTSFPAQRAVIVSNTTTGGAFDPDGYIVTIDGGRKTPMELNETLTFIGVADGTHTVTLNGISSNCAVSGGSTRSVILQRGQSARLDFVVSCTPTPELSSIRIVFSHESAIVAMNADGSGRVQLSSGAFTDYGPDVSPDGQKIAFMRYPRGELWPNSEIYTMNADGTGVTRIAGRLAYDPDWSPDGRRIVFSAFAAHWGGPINVMEADGSGALALTSTGSTEDAWPAWSPDGTRIAFTRADLMAGGTASGIWIMGADGENAARLSKASSSGGWRPVWSPDGSKIAFSDAVRTGRIWVINADGSGEASVLESDVQLVVYDWSADGQMLLFVKRLRTGHDIYLLRLQDRTVVRLTAGGVSGDPTFWPRAR
jgi:Tol biopolymer transport system component